MKVSDRGVSSWMVERTPIRLSSDFDWFWVSLAMTLALALVSISLMGFLSFSAFPNPFISLASWTGWTVFAIGFSTIFYTLKLMRAGEESPTRRLLENWQAGRRRYAFVVAGMILAGADMYFFMILKPELDLLFPFWADPHLARLDALLLGKNGWEFFRSWNLDVVSWVYSPFWFFSILLTFYWLLLKPASAAKSTAVVGYFSTWSVFGPLGQAAFPSGGPIFYERLGFGHDFDQMPVPHLTQTLSNYLWEAYTSHSLAPGAGISAMPSLHIATMAWMVMAFAAFRSRWTQPAALLSLYIYAGSVALGWHYATDGLVGAAGAAACFYVPHYYFRTRQRAAPLMQISQPLTE